MSGLQQTLCVRPRPVAGYGPLARLARDAWAWLARCGERVSQRRVLAEFTDWQLRDIGISRAEADGEAGKWFWRP
jgi:uncharacterized protein YjiS (DUF1127 family)